jgi:multisubunit Na+/H+ antiporter MnhG subunit
MTIFVALLGALVVIAGAVGVVSPARFRGMFTAMPARTRFVLAVVIRLAMGALLWFLADELRHPLVMRVLAVIAVVAAVVILVMGQARLDRFVDWWLERSDSVMRVSCLIACAFGAYLVYVTT